MSNNATKSSLPYNAFGNYVKEKFGEYVWKIPLDADFTCPNRDGTRGYAGCTYCTDDGSSSRQNDPTQKIKEQIQKSIDNKRHLKFMAYLQSFTNTHGKTLDELKAIYDQAIAHQQIVMLSIGTRPDSLNQEIVELIQSYTKINNLEVWIDIGLQTIHDQTQVIINRLHTLEEFDHCLDLLEKYAPDVKICIHLMAGLPSETDEMFIKSVSYISNKLIHGVKLHNLCIFQKTRLALDYKLNKIKPLAFEEYQELVIKALEVLPSNIIIHRLMAEAPDGETLIAPYWVSNKNFFLQTLVEEMKQRNTMQGKKYIKIS